MSSNPSDKEKNNSPAKSESSSSSNKEEEIKNLNNDSDCESIISERESTFLKKNNEMMQKIIRSKLGGKSILEIAKDLNNSIGSLDGKINTILSKHHRDYIVTFNEFMNTVKKDLREKIDELERIDGEKKKSEDIFVLKAERDFFRKEAIRLNEICIEQDKNFDDIKKDFDMKKDEYDSLYEKFRETEFLNKEILLELEENIKTIRKLEKEKKLNEKKQNEKNTNLNINMKIPSFNNLYNSIEKEKNFTTTNYNQKLINSTLYNTHSDNNNNTENNEGYKNSNLMNYNTLGTSIISFKGREHSNERKKNFSMNSNYNFDSNNNNTNTNTQTIEDFDSDNYNLNPNKTFFFDGNKEKIIRFIDRIKIELKKEKMKSNKLIGELNNIVSDRKKLERIFIDCFEESRKEILQRKMKDTINWKGALFNMSSSTNLRETRNSLPKISEIKFENFQTSDKRKLVENFLLCDEVINLLKQFFGDKIIDNNTTSSNFHRKSFAENFKNLNLDYKNNVGDLKMNNDMNFVNGLKKSKSKSISKLNSLKIPLLKK